jgi:hypothetical protein
MGLTQKLGTLPLAILTDASNNVGIGAAPSGSYKLEVTGTAKVSGALTGTSADFSGLVTGGGTIRATGATGGLSTGSGVEIRNNSSVGEVFAYNRSTSAYLPLRLDGSTLSINTITSGAITFGGNVGIGTSSPPTKFAVKDGTDTVLQYYASGADGYLGMGNEAGSIGGGGKSFNLLTGTQFTFSTAATERMRITSAGTVAIGSTTRANVWGLLTLRNTSNAVGSMWGIGPDTNNSLTVYNPSNVGVYIVDGGVAWISSSDESLKTDLVPIEDATNKVSSLRSVIGRYKTDEVGTKRAFLIAQDVLKVLPEAINKNKETGNLGVSYTEVIPLLVAAIKELNERLNKAGL